MRLKLKMGMDYREIAENMEIIFDNLQSFHETIMEKYRKNDKLKTDLIVEFNFKIIKKKRRR